MANIATYAFVNAENRDKARDKIVYELGGGYDTGYTSDYYLLHITSDCKDPALAGQICSAYNGKPY